MSAAAGAAQDRSDISKIAAPVSAAVRIVLMSVLRQSRSSCFDRNILSALPQGKTAELGKVLHSFDDRHEVVAGELAQLAGEAHAAVRYQQFCFAVSARIKKKLPRSRIARRIFERQIRGEIGERHPASLAAPSAVNELLSEGK